MILLNSVSVLHLGAYTIKWLSEGKQRCNFARCACHLPLLLGSLLVAWWAVDVSWRVEASALRSFHTCLMSQQSIPLSMILIEIWCARLMMRCNQSENPWMLNRASLHPNHHTLDHAHDWHVTLGTILFERSKQEMIDWSGRSSLEHQDRERAWLSFSNSISPRRCFNPCFCT